MTNDESEKKSKPDFSDCVIKEPKQESNQEHHQESKQERYSSTVIDGNSPQGRMLLQMLASTMGRQAPAEPEHVCTCGDCQGPKLTLNYDSGKPLPWNEAVRRNTALIEREFKEQSEKIGVPVDAVMTKWTNETFTTNSKFLRDNYTDLVSTAIMLNEHGDEILAYMRKKAGEDQVSDEMFENMKDVVNTLGKLFSSMRKMGYDLKKAGEK